MRDCEACPYCKKKFDFEEYYDDGNEETECGHCEKKVIVTTSVSVNHYVEGDCRLNNELPHKLYRDPPIFKDEKPFGPFVCVKCQRGFYDFNLADGQYPRLRAGEYEFTDKEVSDASA